MENYCFQCYCVAHIVLISVHYFSPVAVLSINTLLLLLSAKAFSLSDELWYMQQKFLIRFDRLILQVHRLININYKKVFVIVSYFLMIYRKISAVPP